jgi:hypothetical protein
MLSTSSGTHPECPEILKSNIKRSYSLEKKRNPGLRYDSLSYRCHLVFEFFSVIAKSFRVHVLHSAVLYINKKFVEIVFIHQEQQYASKDNVESA